MSNYCKIEEAVNFTASKLSAEDFQESWLNMVDALIEQYTGQGYKGAERTATIKGSGGSLLKLPSSAEEITSLKENGSLLGPNDYSLETGGRLVERTATTSYPSYFAWSGVWPRGCKYVIVYREPTIVPETYHIAAVNCMTIIGLFVQKYKEFGVALTASDYGSAGKVATQASTTFPANLMEELKRTIQTTIRRSSI